MAERKINYGDLVMTPVRTHLPKSMLEALRSEAEATKRTWHDVMVERLRKSYEMDRWMERADG